MAVGRTVAVDTTAGGTVIASDDINRSPQSPLTVIIQAPSSTTIYLGGPGVDSTGLVFNTTLYPSGLVLALYGKEKIYGLSSSGSLSVRVLELNK